MKIEACCRACGKHYSDRPERIGHVPFCSRECRVSKAATRARFLANIDRQPDGCWTWTGGKSFGGYGKFYFSGKTSTAHRYAYIEYVGPIPDGLHLDHLCRNRACCNPAHLEAVTCRENLLRGEGLQAKNAVKTHCPSGHEYSESNTYRYPDGRRRCIACRRAADNKDAPRERRKLYKRKLREAAA